MRIDRLDHLVLTVADLEATVDFYTRILGMTPTTFGGGHRALVFGQSKINLHQAGQEFEPKATHPIPGSADLCLITTDSLEQVITELVAYGVPIEEGPINAGQGFRYGSLTPCWCAWRASPRAWRRSAS